MKCIDFTKTTEKAHILDPQMKCFQSFLSLVEFNNICFKNEFQQLTTPKQNKLTMNVQKVNILKYHTSENKANMHNTTSCFFYAFSVLNSFTSKSELTI